MQPYHAPHKPLPRLESSVLPKIVFGIAVVVGAFGLYWLLARTGLIAVISDKAALRPVIERLGIWGPATIVALEAIAIVASPLPSAPVALVAGAVYGALLGTVLVVVGAVLGAVTAFVIARCLGFEVIKRWGAAERYLDALSRDHSQRWLMGAVLISRLLPFVSFDAVSYVAGLTPLAFWRFTLATLAGVVPVSFLLTFAGETLIEANANLVLVIIVGLVVLPFAAAAVHTLCRAIFFTRR
jgi:uncharacterized membrane protein YdjX (TVP38/TMEM64 family)